MDEPYVVLRYAAAFTPGGDDDHGQRDVVYGPFPSMAAASAFYDRLATVTRLYHGKGVLPLIPAPDLRMAQEAGP
jgi:hypothetical protein